MARAVHYRIIGSGPVALACALFMVRSGIDPRRVTLRLPELAHAGPAAAHDADEGASACTRGSTAAGVATAAGGDTKTRRMLAISDGSRQLLSRIIMMPTGAVIERIEVALSGRSGRTRIEAGDFKLPALGHVIAYSDLLGAMRTAAGRIGFGSAQDAPGTASDSGTAPGPGPTEEVTIHADGIPRQADSMGREFRIRNFRQAALLTEVMAETAGTSAYECFGHHGPLALLPAGHGHSPRYAVVWCDDPSVTAERAAMTPSGLSTALTEAFAAFGTSATSAAFAGFGRPRSAVGELRVCSAIEVAPLTRVRRVNSACGREAWIGNAAQALHPVAGQGFNLGLRDAFELARSLADNEYAQNPLAPEQVLKRFAAQRRIDRSITTGVTDLLAAGMTWPLARPLQSALLTALDLLPPVRRPLASALLFGSR